MPPPDLNPRAASILKNAVAATLDDGLLKSVLPARAVSLPPEPGQGPARQVKPPAVASARHTAPPGAAPRHAAPLAPARPPARPNPMGRRAAPGGTDPGARGAAGARTLQPIQLTGARLLLEGKSVTAVAAELGVHRYTIARWKSDPVFQAELRRQVERAAWRNKAPHGATPPRPAQNELPGR